MYLHVVLEFLRPSLRPILMSLARVVRRGTAGVFRFSQELEIICGWCLTKWGLSTPWGCFTVAIWYLGLFHQHDNGPKTLTMFHRFKTGGNRTWTQQDFCQVDRCLDFASDFWIFLALNLGVFGGATEVYTTHIPSYPHVLWPKFMSRKIGKLMIFPIKSITWRGHRGDGLGARSRFPKCSSRSCRMRRFLRRKGWRSWRPNSIQSLSH